MKVERREFDESGPGFRYVYSLYTFEADGVSYVARSYRSEPTEAHFLRKEIGAQSTTLTPGDIQSELFRGAIGYLREAGIRTIRYLSQSEQGYVEI